MKKILLVALLLSGLFIGCVEKNTDLKTQQSQLQIREYQTRIYETKDTKVVMKAVLNALQDEGFIVKNAVSDVGLISAEKTLDIENKLTSFMVALIVGPEATWGKASIIECTANISEYGDKTKVRVNFQVKILNNKGGIKEIKHITDEKYYQEFFSKVDKSVFIQKEKL